ncbi:MAG TPA: hypothetical protein VFU05_17305 [Cyclobacteriaceae bacterium]|nr:hypothetical protein [Cyclobacteriaceae bacterium]
MLRYFFTCVLMMAAAASFAQSKKKKAKEAETPASSNQPSSLNPNYSEKKYEPSKKKRPTGKVTYNATEKFYERQEAIAKQERKAEKEMEKPQYSDPLYFGHKRPPKKRPPSKMKYCKTCGIRH